MGWGSLWLGLCIVPFTLAMIALPFWPWSRQWGYVPSAGLLLLSLIVLLLHVNYIV
jgi:Protein of unknown function (DUF3309)